MSISSRSRPQSRRWRPTLRRTCRSHSDEAGASTRWSPSGWAVATCGLRSTEARVGEALAANRRSRRVADVEQFEQPCPGHRRWCISPSRAPDWSPCTSGSASGSTRSTKWRRRVRPARDRRPRRGLGRGRTAGRARHRTDSVDRRRTRLVGRRPKPAGQLGVVAGVARSVVCLASRRRDGTRSVPARCCSTITARSRSRTAAVVTARI